LREAETKLRETQLLAGEKGRGSSNGSCNDLRSRDAGAHAAPGALTVGVAIDACSAAAPPPADPNPNPNPPSGGPTPSDEWRVVEVPKPRRRSPTAGALRSPPTSPSASKSPKSPTLANQKHSNHSSNSPPQQAAEERLVREAMPWGRMADPKLLRAAIEAAKVTRTLGPSPSPNPTP